MAERITQKHIEALVGRLNKTTKSPAEPYTNVDGKFTANIGNYHIDSAYGGVALHRMECNGGSVSDVFRSGHTTKRELAERIHAFLAGFEAGKGQ
jgi:superoxide dismutase